MRGQFEDISGFSIGMASICFVEAETKRETASSGKLFFSSVCKELEGCELKRRIRNCLQSEFVRNADYVLKVTKARFMDAKSCVDYRNLINQQVKGMVELRTL